MSEKVAIELLSSEKGQRRVTGSFYGTQLCSISQ